MRARPRSGPRVPRSAESSENDSSLALVLSPEAKEYYREVSTEHEDDARFLDAAPCDFFELLGVETDADGADVKSAFRKLQRVVHPDVAGASAEPLAVLLNAAYATLLDDAVRAAYRETVEASEQKALGRAVVASCTLLNDLKIGPQVPARVVFAAAHDFVKRFHGGKCAQRPRTFVLKVMQASCCPC